MAVTRRLMHMVVGGLLAGLLLLGWAGVAAASCTSGSGCLYGNSCTTVTTSTSTVTVGGNFVASGTGWDANQQVVLNICNLETVNATANAAGDFTVTVAIPANASPGTCSITASGKNQCANPTTQTSSVTLTSGTVVPPVHTGEPWSGIVYWLLVGGLAASGLGTILLGRRRRPVPIRS